MSARRRLLIFSLILALWGSAFSATSALAWNRAGHMITGAIAYRELKTLDASALARVVAILKQHPAYPSWKSRMDNMRLNGDDRDLYLFMQAARWPDDMEGPPEVTRRNDHFVNIPFKPGTTTAPAIPTVPSILTAYKEHLATFRGNASDSKKAEALSWIFHLVGDIHQPLHAVALINDQFSPPRGDRGGTLFFIRAERGGQTITLHQFWDGLVQGSQNFQDVTTTAIAIRSKPQHQRDKLPELGEKDFAKWASVESYGLARDQVYSNGALRNGREGNGELLSADYIAAAKITGERRAVLAGYRLADLLASPTTPAPAPALTKAQMKSAPASAPASRPAPAASARGETALYVGFWNIENLFDTVNDPTVDLDEEFTPSGNKNWTPQRLDIKLKNLAQVISKMNDNRGPDVLGLCEVENRIVVGMLISKLGDLGRNYKIVHKDSPSNRGIDCALIYDADVLELKEERFHFVAGAGKTRDIVEARFERNGDPLTVFVNHWPSRGGDGDTESGRIAAAKTLRQRVDQLLSADKQADFVIVGDLNDEPDNISIKTTLKAASKLDGLPPGSLYDSMAPIKLDPKRGTIVFQNKWQVFDHVILSPGLLDQSRFRWRKDSTEPALVIPQLLFDPPGDANIPRPNRSYTGNRFHPDGYADHLPVACVLLQGP